MKNQRGITLVALVITIIILLILAGIAILTLTQTGLLEKTKESREIAKNSQDKETNMLSEYNKKVDEIIGTSTRDQNTSYSLLWEGIAKEKNKTYKFIDSKNLNNYDFLIIEHKQSDCDLTSSSIFSTSTLLANTTVALHGWYQRYTALKFSNTDFTISDWWENDSVKVYVTKIYGIKY